MAMDAQEIAVFSDPVSGMPFQPVGYTAKRITIQDRARERLGDAEKLAASMKQRGNSTAEIQRTLRETVKSISAIMQAELMDALQTAAKAPLSNMLENLKATAAIHDTDPAANIFTLFEAGILTPDALSKRVAHQTGFDPEELEGTLPMEVLAKRNGNTMKHIMKTFDVDQNTALTLMGMRSGGGGGGAGAGARGEPSSLGTSDEDASMSDREHQDKAQAGMDDVAMPTPKGQKGTKQKQAQRGTEEGDSQLDE